MEKEKWVRVEDRLPELVFDRSDDLDDDDIEQTWLDSEKVLAYSESDGILVAYLSKIDDAPARWMTDSDEPFDITHWMPLPDLPEEVLLWEL